MSMPNDQIKHEASTRTEKMLSLPYTNLYELYDLAYQAVMPASTNEH